MAHAFTTDWSLFYQMLIDRLNEGPVVVATVISNLDESICPAGAKLLVWGDAKTAGTLGSIPLEDIVQATFEVMKTGLPQRMGLAGAQVWLARWQGPDAIATAETLLSLLRSSRPGRLVIPLTGGQSPYVLEAGLSLRNLQGQEAYIEDIP